MPIDQRVSPRVTTTIPVGLNFPSGTVKEGWGRITSINASGLMLETRFPMKVSSVVYLTFLLKEGARFDSLRSRIIRCTFEDGYYAAAISFDEVVDKDTLKDVLTALAFEAGVPTV